MTDVQLSKTTDATQPTLGAETAAAARAAPAAGLSVWVWWVAFDEG